MDGKDRAIEAHRKKETQDSGREGANALTIRQGQFISSRLYVR